MANYSRSDRMGEQIRRELSTLVRQEVKDPRVGMVSFTEVRVARDLSHARVFCMVMNDGDEEETIKGLNKAAGFLRSQLSSVIRARTVPQMKFEIDKSLKHGNDMNTLIMKARHSDADYDASSNDETDKE